MIKQAQYSMETTIYSFWAFASKLDGCKGGFKFLSGTVGVLFDTTEKYEGGGGKFSVGDGANGIVELTMTEEIKAPGWWKAPSCVAFSAFLFSCSCLSFNRRSSSSDSARSFCSSASRRWFSSSFDFSSSRIRSAISFRRSSSSLACFSSCAFCK